MAQLSGENKPKGKILKEAREAQGISLDTVHEMTKIPMDVLRAIEEGYTVRSLTPFYLKGFLKMYAQYLGLPVDDIVDDRKVEKLPKPLPPDRRADEISVKVDRIFTKQRKQSIVKVAGVLLVVFCVVRVAGCVVNHKKSVTKKTVVVASTAPGTVPADIQKSAKKKESVEKKTPVPTPKPVKKEEPPALPVKPQIASVTPKEGVEEDLAVEEDAPKDKKNISQKVKLTVKAAKKGWLQVKADGNIVFQSVLEEGAAETWQAEKSIELSGKNIHNLEFEVNGKVLGGLGRADRSARRVVITKDGMTVKE